MSIELSSTAFQKEMTIPKKYTGDGADRSPQDYRHPVFNSIPDTALSEYQDNSIRRPIFAVGAYRPPHLRIQTARPAELCEAGWPPR